MYIETRASMQKKSKFSVADLIMDHVISFPPKNESCYEGKKAKKKYLSQNSNISRLFRLSTDKCKSTEIIREQTSIE